MSGVKRECAQRPRNHTRTCNKLPDVYMCTPEVEVADINRGTLARIDLSYSPASPAACDGSGGGPLTLVISNPHTTSARALITRAATGLLLVDSTQG